MNNNYNIIKFILFYLLLNTNIFAESENKQIEITAIVPKFCKFEVEHTMNQAGIDLSKPGTKRIHIANIHLDCNSTTEYSIILHSNNSFKLTNTNKPDLKTVPYELEIKGLSTITNLSPTDKKLLLSTSTLVNTFEVYMVYTVETLIPGNYNDNLNILLQAD